MERVFRCYCAHSYQKSKKYVVGNSKNYTVTIYEAGKKISGSTDAY